MISKRKGLFSISVRCYALHVGIQAQRDLSFHSSDGGVHGTNPKEGSRIQPTPPACCQLKQAGAAN